MTAAELAGLHCTPRKKGEPALPADNARALMAQLHDDWQLDRDNRTLTRNCKFSNYHETMAFVNAMAWIAHREDHHPDIEVGYNRCIIHYSTHAIGGLSENDFICAAKIDHLLNAA